MTKQDFARTVQTLATRDDLDQRTEELKAYTDERFTELKAYTNEKTDTLSTQIEALARMVQEGFEDLQQRLDVREQVARHDRDIRAIKQALHLSK